MTSTFALCAVLVILAVIPSLYASPRTCYKCKGINCFRTSHNVTELCADPLDICVTIYDSFEVTAKGCLLEIPMTLRSRCQGDRKNPECYVCNENLCNDVGREDYHCIQCDSSSNNDCKSNPMAIKPTRCPISTSPNSYCYVEYKNGQTIRGCSGNTRHQRACYNSDKCMLSLAGEIKNSNAVDFNEAEKATTPSGGGGTTQPGGGGSTQPGGGGSTQPGGAGTTQPGGGGTTQPGGGGTTQPGAGDTTQNPTTQPSTQPTTEPSTTTDNGSSILASTTFILLLSLILINIL